MIIRGGVYWAELGKPRGSAPAIRRPVVVVQADNLNQSDWRTTIAAPLTSNTSRSTVPGHVFVPASASGLPRDSALVASQLVVIDKDELAEEPAIGQLPPHLMGEVDAALRIVLDL